MFNGKMLPQPPPNAPAPPLSETAACSRRWRSWIVVLGTISILGLCFSVNPLIRRSKKNVELYRASYNGAHVAIALDDFRLKIGAFPDALTSVTLVTETGTSLALGRKTSNDYFRQLIANGSVTGEEIFYCKIKGTTKPDQIVSPGYALKKGECGFSYILGAESFSTGTRPLVVSPLIPGTLKFDPRPFKGKPSLLSLVGLLDRWVSIKRVM